MRVLHVVSDTDRRGAQVFATDLDAALRHLGHHGRAVALVPGRVGGLDLPVLGSRWPALGTLRALRDAMADADVTVAHGSSTGPACAVAGPGRPFVYRQISDSRFWAPTLPKRWRVRIVLARARRVVALSEFNRAELIDWIGVRPDRIVVVPNGVSASRFLPASGPARAAARKSLGLDPDAPVIACTNALVPEKGTDAVIRAVATIPEAVLVVAGDGPERDALERLADAVAPGRVRFLGSVDDATTLYHATDIVVLASRGGDAMPASLIEAGLCGLPVVSTEVGAIPEVVVDGVTGFVCPPGDDAAITTRLASLVAEPGDRARMGTSARSHCLARYEIGVVAARWADVLSTVITEARGPA